jgi:hypothetical protein
MNAKLKGVLIAAGGLLVIIAVGFVIWGQWNHKQYLIEKGQAIVLKQQFDLYKANAEKIEADLTAQAVILLAEKNAAIDAADKASAKAGQIQAALDIEIAKTAALQPDALSGNINQRIGAGQSWPTAGGVFSFTRPGTEATLNLFLTGESSAAKYQSEQVVSTNLRVALGKSEAETGNIGQRLTLTQTELDKLGLAYGAQGNSLKYLERSIVGVRIKTFVEGAVIGAAVVTVLHLVKVI